VAAFEASSAMSRRRPRGPTAWASSAVLIALVAVPPNASAHPGKKARLHALTHAIERAPNDPALRLARAFEYRQAGRFAAAAADATAAIRVEPSPEAFTERAAIASARGDAERAMQDLERALALRPDWADALAARARLYLARADEEPGRLEAARRDFDVAIAVRPSPELVLERLRVDERRGDAQAASSGLREGVVVTGAVVLVLEWMRVDSERGALDGAILAAEHLLAIQPDHPGWLLARARLAEQASRPDVARFVYELALQSVERQLEARPTEQRERWRAEALAALGR
jgi:tetratricopeptide (TPR) repeat protein